MTIETHLSAIRALLERDRQLAEANVLSPERHEASVRCCLTHVQAIEHILTPPPCAPRLTVVDGGRP